MEDNICQTADSTPGSSGLTKTNETIRDKHACATSCANSDDRGKKLDDINIQKEELFIIPSSPTLEFPEDIDGISNTESRHSSTSSGSVLDTPLRFVQTVYLPCF